MAISFGAIGERYVTFLAGSGAEAGVLCKVTGNAEVGACASGDCFCGVVTQVRGGTASVLMGGYVELPYTGTAPAAGFAELVADGAGGGCGVEAGGDGAQLSGGACGYSRQDGRAVSVNNERRA